MRKRILSGLFALVLLTNAGYGVQKTMKSEANLSDLALANVEALAQNESGGTVSNEDACRNSGGIWNEALHCTDGGASSVVCSVEGQLNFAGKIINGNYKVGVTYPILWERWECEQSSGNCCDGSKQGVKWA